MHGNWISELAIGSLSLAVAGGLWAGLKAKVRPSVDPADLHGKEGEAMVDAALRSAGVPTLTNVFLDSWRGNITELDLLAFVGAEIMVIEVKAWAGEIRGQAEDAEWTQRKEHGESKSMRNPILQNRHHVQQAQRAFPHAVFSNVVVFTEVVFPAGAPAGVLNIDGLLSLVRTLRAGQPNNSTVFAWGKLSSISGCQDKAVLRAKLLAKIAQVERKDDYVPSG